MRTLLFSLLIGSSITTFAQSSDYVSQVWVADQGDGTYRNPVLYADYSDPDAIRVGDDFYLTSSSFGCLPGLQILHSKDLVNWQIVSAAVPYSLTPHTRYSSATRQPCVGSVHTSSQRGVLHLLGRP